MRWKSAQRASLSPLKLLFFTFRTCISIGAIKAPDGWVGGFSDWIHLTLTWWCVQQIGKQWAREKQLPRLNVVTISRRRGSWVGASEKTKTPLALAALIARRSCLSHRGRMSCGEFLRSAFRDAAAAKGRTLFVRLFVSWFLRVLFVSLAQHTTPLDWLVLVVHAGERAPTEAEKLSLFRQNKYFLIWEILRQLAKSYIISQTKTLVSNLFF